MNLFWLREKEIWERGKERRDIDVLVDLILILLKKQFHGFGVALSPFSLSKSLSLLAKITAPLSMDDPFELIVSYRGDSLSFTAILLQYGYTHKIQVMVNDQQVIFEPDEERNYRAVINSNDGKEPGKVDRSLLEAIAETIESIVK